jgi:hypothetical protein
MFTHSIVSHSRVWWRPYTLTFISKQHVCEHFLTAPKMTSAYIACLETKNTIRILWCQCSAAHGNAFLCTTRVLNRSDLYYCLSRNIRWRDHYLSHEWEALSNYWCSIIWSMGPGSINHAWPENNHWSSSFMRLLHSHEKNLRFCSDVEQADLLNSACCPWSSSIQITRLGR